MIVSFDVVFSAVISILIVTCFTTAISFLWEMKKVPKDTDIDDTIHAWSGLVTGFCVCVLLTIVFRYLRISSLRTTCCSTTSWFY